jgi:hypothetical protein
VNRKKIWIVTGTLALIVGALWAFPAFWFTKGSGLPRKWLTERQEVPSYKFNEVPVSESAERILVADKTFNGEFVPSNLKPIRVFLAKRYVEKQNEIGLFVHTPDRCWLESGWEIEPVSPQIITVKLDGEDVPFERRIFEARGNRELVYFAGLVGGRPLPYRLDQNLSVAMRYQVGGKGDRTGSIVRVSDGHFWKRLWDAFTSREELLGPKQFVRVSTPVTDGDVAAGDERLQEFLKQWLVPGDYQREREAWQLAAVEHKN